VTADLASLWDELAGLDAKPGLTARRCHAEAPLDVYVGLESPGGTRLVLIEATSGALSGVGDVTPRCAGFSVTLERGTTPGRSRIVVRLALSAYRDVFTALVSDLLDSMATAQTEATAVVSFVGRLERWQRLLARHGPDGLSIMEQRGLYGELLLIRDHLLSWTTPDVVAAAWTGPLAKDQDFQFAGCSIEVKVSTTNPDHEVHISNVRQLDESASPSGSLILFHASLEERHEQGESLVSMVDSVRKMMGPLSGRLDDLIEQVGYLDVHAPRYAHTGYVIKKRGFFIVRDGFPRILERELRPGVGDVRYTVQLGACAPYSIAESEVIASMRGGK
jgi:hypothetical protein